MSKTIRFTLMLALVALAAWTSTPKAAHALPVCNNIQGRACSPANRTLSCTWSGGGGIGLCICDADLGTWDCL